jgi:hypothetical protein
MAQFEVIPLVGFDPEGEPEVRVMNDGTLCIVFNFMPPSWAEDESERFDNFDQQLATAIGVPVVWDDREFFRVPGPVADTVERIRIFLETFPRRKVS